MNDERQITADTNAMAQSPSQASRRAHPELRSQAELNSTVVSPAAAKVMSIAFVLIALAVPAIDTISQLAGRRDVTALDVLRPIPRAVSAATDGEGRRTLSELRPLATPEFLHGYEEALGDRSMLKQVFQPRLQDVLTGPLGFGNDKAVIGRKGWLFYQPGVDYLTGPGFLDPAHLRRRAQKMANQGEGDPQPDPRPAILRFHEDCERAGVHLVVAIIPDKAQLQPAQLTRRLAFDRPTEPMHNRDFDRFVSELRSAGVDVFDPTPALINPGEVRYLMQDTHWTPQFMRQVACDLATHIRQRVPMFSVPAPLALKTEPQTISRLGDLVGMLKLSDDQRIFSPQQVTIEQVQDAATGKPWKPDRSADVLLLGDSFANIYSDGGAAGGLGWGSGAGLAPQLSRYLNRPVDVIARNGSGASMTRMELARRPDPFGGKRTIVWEFAARDLSNGNWTVIPITANRAASAPVAPGEFVVDAELLTPVPPDARRSEVYVDAVVVLKFKVVKVIEGKYDGGEILLKLPSILNRQLQPAASMKKGQAYRLAVKKESPPRFNTVQMIDQTGEFDLPALWCESVSEKQE